MPLPVTPPDRQDLWGPTWLVDLSAAAASLPGPVFQADVFDAAAFQTAGVQEALLYRFSTRDLDTLAVPYWGRLVSDPEVERTLQDTFWGVTEIAEIRFSLENVDGALDAFFVNDIRGLPVTISRYDWISATTVEVISAVLTRVAANPGVVSFSAVDVDLLKFEELIPKVVVARPPFRKRIPEESLGRVVPVVFGTVQRIPLPWIRDGVNNNTYDYVVGHGSLEVMAVYRDAPNARNGVSVVNPPEYEVSTTLYPGYTTIRFRVRQVNFQNTFHTIYADVRETATGRNFVKVVREILTNTTWGLGGTVDEASFTQAEVDLAASGTVYCDGALIEQQQAQEWLRQLLLVYGMRLGVNASGQWTLTVDTAQTTIAMRVGDGPGDGERNIVEARQRTRRTAQDSVSTYTLRYKVDYANISTFRFSQSRTVTVTGRAKEIKHNFITNHETADRVIDRVAKRERYAEETAEFTLNQEARALVLGNLVSATYAPFAYVAATLEVLKVVKATDFVRVVAAPWSADIFTYTPGTLPTDEEEIAETGRVPRPGGFELVGLPRSARPATGQIERFVGLGNVADFTGRDVRIRWHRTAVLPMRGIDEDDLQTWNQLVRDYVVTIYGHAEVAP